MKKIDSLSLRERGRLLSLFWRLIMGVDGVASNGIKKGTIKDAERLTFIFPVAFESIKNIYINTNKDANSDLTNLVNTLYQIEKGDLTRPMICTVEESQRGPQK